MPKLQRLLIALSFTLLLPGIVQAEVDNGATSEPQTSHIGAMPSRGMTMATVKQHFGEPDRRYPAVGKPPISRWQYEGMMVYFESNYVIHSVATDNNHK